MASGAAVLLTPQAAAAGSEQSRMQPCRRPPLPPALTRHATDRARGPIAIVEAFSIMRDGNLGPGDLRGEVDLFYYLVDAYVVNPV